MKYKLRNSCWLFVMLSVFFLVGCSYEEQDSRNPLDENQEESLEGDVTNSKESLQSNHLNLYDNNYLYKEYEDTSVVTMYLTVRGGNDAEHTNHTWGEVNAYSAYYYEERNIERYQVEGILQVGNDSGPEKGEFGYGQVIPNATVSIRGQTSTRRAIKSYKISIKDGKGTWRDQQVINLNKHVGDGLRFRNKLCYDLMEELPDMISLQTQFVHLYVKDETEGTDSSFVDYGLYTQVEQPNKTFLQTHGLDRYGQLYKINFFEFHRYEDVIQLKSDATYDEETFENLLEIKGSDDHSKIITLLEELNDISNPIEEVFPKWFEEDNFFAWMAFHILVGNVDTQSRNTLLYSPRNVNCFYFISWDNDVAFRMKEDELRKEDFNRGWNYGISNYWGNVLFQRVLKSEQYQRMLDQKIEEYKKILTEEKLEQMVSQYDRVTWDFRNRFPDQWSNPITNEEYRVVCEELPKEVERNYQLYLKSKEQPMPFYIGLPSVTKDTMKYVWDIAYDFDAEDITYTFELARDYLFENPIIRQESIILPEVTGEKLEPGQYFIRVIAKNKSGYSQYAFDYYVAQNEKIYGTKCFYVLEDGSIVEDVREE